MEERIVRVGPVSLAARSWHRPSGPCVILVHGLGHNMETWGSLVPLLRDFCTVVAFDRRGHGHSSDATDYRAATLANDVGAIASSYAITDPILVGHSIGAWDCLRYAERGSACAVICLDQAIASDDPVWRGSLDTTESPNDRGYSDAEIAEHFAHGAATLGEAAWREIYGPMNQRAIVRRPDGLFYYRPDSRNLREIRSAWRTFAAGGEPYDNIDCRVVVVLAHRNTGPIHDALERLIARRSVEFVNADTDHDVHIQQPRLIADLIRELGIPSH